MPLHEKWIRTQAIWHREQRKSFNESMNLSLEGIGATLQQTEDDGTTIKSLVPGAPAERSKN